MDLKIKVVLLVLMLRMSNWLKLIQIELVDIDIKINLLLMHLMIAKHLYFIVILMIIRTITIK